MRIVFLDCETTGLDPVAHEVWEVGAIVRDSMPEGIESHMPDVEHHWFLPLRRFETADPFALDIGKFWERYVWPDAKKYTEMDEWCRMFMQMTKGATIVGAIPNFDTERLDRLLKEFGYKMFHHYHLVCVENLAAGMYHMPPPWKSDDLADRLGYKRNKDDRHTALGDAREVRDWYDIIMAKSSTGSDSTLQG